MIYGLNTSKKSSFWYYSSSLTLKMSLLTIFMSNCSQIVGQQNIKFGTLHIVFRGKFRVRKTPYFTQSKKYIYFVNFVFFITLHGLLYNYFMISLLNSLFRIHLGLKLSKKAHSYGFVSSAYYMTTQILMVNKYKTRLVTRFNLICGWVH